MSPQTKNWIFGIWFGLCFLLSLCPPLYLAAGRDQPRVAGLPFSAAYMIFVGLLITLSIVLVYLVERTRDEVD
jgi:hypothetical protein